MQKIAIAVSDFDSHKCALGAEGGCGVCKAKAEFYRVSNAKWARLKERWRTVSENMNRRHLPDAMMISAIMTDHEQEAVWKK